MDDELPEKQALRKAAAELGGQAGVAEVLGYEDRRNVWPWFNTARRIPAEHCPALERECGLRAATVHCEALRPDVAWHRVPDADWPWHPQGRPLIDVSRQTDVALAKEGVRDVA